MLPGCCCCCRTCYLSCVLCTYHIYTKRTVYVFYIECGFYRIQLGCNIKIYKYNVCAAANKIDIGYRIEICAVFSVFCVLGRRPTTHFTYRKRLLNQIYNKFSENWNILYTWVGGWIIGYGVYDFSVDA